MSLIYGIVDLCGKEVYEVNRKALSKALNEDGFDNECVNHENVFCGYGFKRGRIPRAGILNNKRLTILADIRIYNSEVLKKDLEFDTPEEALAKAYLQWGVDCGKHINGDFAAVILDKEKSELHLIRDHIGTRPLTYAISGTSVMFASHGFGIIGSGIINTSISEDELIRQFLWSKKDDYEQTIFEHVKNVLPGHIVTINLDRDFNKKSAGPCTTDDNQIKFKKYRYWNPATFTKKHNLTYEQTVSHLRELLIKATRSRMEDVPTALHVSGGIDSTGIASIVADLTKDKNLLTGYSYAPEEFDEEIVGANEKEFIEEYVKDKGMKVKFQKYEENELLKKMLIPEFGVQNIELPLMKRVSLDGSELVFSGWGGDEFLSLSLRGTFNHLFFSFKWAELFAYIKKTGIRTAFCKFNTEVLPLIVPFGLVNPFKHQRMDWTILKYLKRDFIIRNYRKIFFNSSHNIYGFGERSRFVLNLLEKYHLAKRMDCWAANGEKYGLEYRYPLLDKDLLEFWFRMPVEYTYKDFAPRLIYRDIMKGILAEKIRNRKEKSDTILQAFSQSAKKESVQFLVDSYKSLKELDHLPCFRQETLEKQVSRMQTDRNIKGGRDYAKLVLYLRLVNLSRKYNLKKN